MTISSTSVIDAWDTLRPAGATARQMLIDAAARQWAVNAARLRTDSGWVIDDKTNQRAGYGELAELASRERPTANPILKDPATYRIVGHNLPRLDTQIKATGTAEFGIDVVRPDMLYATVVHSPVAGTKVASFATNGAEQMTGVQAIVLAGEPGNERSVAVAAENTWQAMQAAQKITVVPEAATSDLVDSATLGKRYLALLDAPDNVVFRDDGQTDTVMQSAADVVTAVYELPYLSHACMEPMNCTAWFTGSSLEVWAPTQANSMARDIGAKICNLNPDQVTLHTTFMGGGFGRRAEMDFVEQAVSVARQLPGRPVKLTWSREQDIRHDAFRPASVCRIRGVIDADGALLALDYRLATQSVVASYYERTPTPRGGLGIRFSSKASSMNWRSPRTLTLWSFDDARYRADRDIWPY